MKMEKKETPPEFINGTIKINVFYMLERERKRAREGGDLIIISPGFEERGEKMRHYVTVKENK